MIFTLCFRLAGALAVFALRSGRSKHTVDGLTAIAMIEPDRIDYRDALVALSLLYHAARGIGENCEHLFGKTACIAEPRMSELILGFLKRSEEDRDIQKSWGYTVVQTQAGPAFFGWGLKRYEPTYALDQMALALAQYMQQQKYAPTSITLASSFPAVWLASVDDSILNEALKCVCSGND